MYAEISFALVCFAIGFICGVFSFVTILVKGLRALTRRKKPKG